MPNAGIHSEFGITVLDGLEQPAYSKIHYFVIIVRKTDFFFPHNYLILPNVAELAIVKVPINHYRIRRKYRTIRYILGRASR